MERPMRIALVCTGLGRVQRGFETAAAQLFDKLRSHHDVVLYQGARPSGSGRVYHVPNIPRAAWKSLISDRRSYRYEQLTFSAGLMPFLLAHRPDVVHYPDITLGNAVRKIRDLLSLRFVMVMWNGGPSPPHHVESCDFVQQVSPVEYRQAVEYGVPESRMTLVPNGLDCERFSAGVEHTLTRRRYGIPENRQIVLSCAAINSSHKRIDYLIEEFSRLDPNRFFLVVAGQRHEETPAIERLARGILKNNCLFLTVPNFEMPALYRAADIMVLCSLREGLPIVLLEAMASGIPVVAHDSELFRWVMGSSNCLIDMQVSGHLATKIKLVLTDPDKARSAARINLANVQKRFDWAEILPQYVQMYERAIHLGRRPIVGTRGSESAVNTRSA